MPDRHQPQLARAYQEERSHVPEGVDVQKPRDVIRHREHAPRQRLPSAAEIPAVAVEPYRDDAAVERAGGRDRRRDGPVRGATHQCGPGHEEIGYPRVDRGREFVTEVRGERNELRRGRRTGRRHEPFDIDPRQHLRFAAGRHPCS